MPVIGPSPYLERTRTERRPRSRRSPTVIHAREELAKEARKAARKQARKPHETVSAPTDRRQRAQRFLKDTLAGGPKPVTAVEEAAAKAHLDERALNEDVGL
jgi:hypothetical protein